MGMSEVAWIVIPSCLIALWIGWRGFLNAHHD
jgi:hypothetical protein